MVTDSDADNQIHGQSASDALPTSDKARADLGQLGQRRKKEYDKRIILTMALVAVLGLGAIVLILTLTLGNMKSTTSPVDESKVKADAGLQVDPAPDDSMASARAAAIKHQQELEDKARRDKEQQDANRPDPKQDGTGQNTANSSNASQVDRSGPQAYQGSQNQEPPPLTPAQRKMMGGVVMSANLQNVTSSGATVAGGYANEDRSSRASSSRSDSTPQRQAMLDEQAALSGAGGGGLGDISSSRSRGSLSNLSGTTFTPSKAVLAPKRKYLLTHGTYARCVLYTEIVTDQPGIIDCRLTEPVYSADGSTMLAAAGDRLTGEQSVEVKAGQVNVFTSWTEMDTEAGVRARLDSLGAGPMGASGTEAWIDNHYLQRFGGAVMLSFIQDALQAAANTTQKSSSSGGYTVNNSEQNVESMASKVLDSTINIPPTAHISPGTVMTVIVARDIDFSSVFENR